MTRPGSPMSTVAPLAALIVLLAACQAGGAGSPSAATSADDAVALVAVTESTEVGAHLVDAEGRTLYVFLEDAPGTSSCDAGCADAWPPASVEEGTSLTAGSAVTAELGTIERDDGTLQLTLDGWPLYRYAADAGPGQVTGEGVGGAWFVARADGAVPSPPPGAEASAPASAEPSADGGSYDPYDY